MRTVRLFVVSFVTAWLAAAGFADVHYKVLNKIPMEGKSGWDYLTADVNNRRLYIAHGIKVEVVDLDTLKVVGTIPGTPGVHGVAVAAPLGKGFITNGKIDSVTIFDLKSLKKTGEVPTEKNPDAILFDPMTSRVFAFNGRSNSSTVIDAREGEFVSAIPLPGKPEFGVADGNGRIYVNIEDKNSLVRINSRGLRVEETWPLPGCQEPSSLAMDQAHQRLFIGCRDKVMAVVDAENGKTITMLPIGDHVDATVFDAEMNLIFNSNGDGTLTVIHEDSPGQFHLVENVPTQRGARTVALDSKTHRLFLVTAEFGPPPTPTAEHPHPRPSIVPGTFTLIVVGQ